MNKTAVELLGVTRSFEEAWMRIFQAWSEGTETEYSSKVRIMEDYVRELRRREGRSSVEWIEEEEFIRFIDALALKERSGSTFEGYRSAMVWKGVTARDTTLLTWSKGTMTRMYVAGAAYKGGKGGRKNFDAHGRGNINVEQFKQILSVCALEKKAGGKMEMYMWGFTLAFLLLVRHGELIGLRYEDFKEHEFEGLMFFVESPKGRRRSNALKEGEWRPVLEDAKEAARNIIEGAADKGQLLILPEWDRKEANRIIARAADMFCWNTKLNWDMHSMRHVRAVISLTDKIELDKIMKAGGWKSQRTLLNVYGKRGRDAK